MEPLAILVIITSSLSLLSLLILHFVSPEFKPSWRMISEYALGKHKWLITAFFILWGCSSLFLVALLWNSVNGFWGILGLILLFISAIGEIMGGLFDVKHKLHGAAFGIGVPTLPAAALLISYNLLSSDIWSDCSRVLLFSAHATWISLILMSLAMAVMFSGFKKAGIPMNKDSQTMETLPEGVIGLGGYANRILIICYEGWLLVTACCYLQS